MKHDERPYAYFQRLMRQYIAVLLAAHVLTLVLLLADEYPYGLFTWSFVAIYIVIAPWWFRRMMRAKFFGEPFDGETRMYVGGSALLVSIPIFVVLFALGF